MPDLSIIIPVAPNREKRLKAVLSRLTLNKALFPDHSFEVVVLDGGSTDGTRNLCEIMAAHIDLKYIYVPIGRFINAAYPRNVMLRACEGKVIGMIDIDHWPSENIVFGMLNPFIEDGKNLYSTQYNDSQVEKVAPNSMYISGIKQGIINRGYVIDSSKSKRFLGQQQLELFNSHMLAEKNAGWEIMDVYKQAQIPSPGVNGTLWTWSLARQDLLPLNGYDELYCRRFAYCREDDDWRERLLASGLNFFDQQHENFCAIHLWHPAACRDQSVNELNKKYFANTCQPVKQVKRNEGWEWGKLIKYSLSIIDGVLREPKEHEEWVKLNVPDMPNYVDKPRWDSTDTFMEKLEEYAKV